MIKNWWVFAGQPIPKDSLKKISKSIGKKMKYGKYYSYAVYDIREVDNIVVFPTLVKINGQTYDKDDVSLDITLTPKIELIEITKEHYEEFVDTINNMDEKPNIYG